MHRFILSLLAGFALCQCASAPAPPRVPTTSLLPRVLIETTLGSIEIEIDSVRAPVTSTNFLRYVDAGLYDGGRFHRSVTRENQSSDPVRIEVIQAGGNPARNEDRGQAIPLERTSVTGLSHRNGTISMARGGPDTAVSDFFICIGDQPSLDFGGNRNPDGQGFAAFGRVVEGMNIVRLIQRAPVTRQSLTPPIAITRMRRL